MAAKLEVGEGGTKQRLKEKGLSGRTKKSLFAAFQSKKEKQKFFQ